jgi:flagellar hook-associated protein 2
MTSVPSLSSTGFIHMNNMAGIDIDALVSATIAADSIPITLMQNKNTILQNQLSDYGTIKSTLFSLNSAINDLTYNSSFTGRIATSTDDKITTGTAQNGSSTGAYVIQVDALATTTNAISTALNFAAGIVGDGTKATLTGSGIVDAGVDRNVPLNRTGSFTVNNQRIDVAATDTINTVLNKISASSAGVTATIDGSGHVVLTQKSVGATPTVTLGTDSSGFLAQVGLDTTTLVAGTDQAQKQTLDAAFGAGTITAGYFSINGTYFAVDPTKDTVDSLVSKINSSTTAGVVAFYDSTTKKLAITNQASGSKTITLGTSATDSSNFLSKVGLDASSVHAGTDAQVSVNGISVTPTNNVVTFNGNKFTINGKGTATVTVNNDTDSMVKKVQAFIDAYNTALDQVDGKLNEQAEDSTEDKKQGGDLFGDSTLSDISQKLRSFSFATVSSQPSSMQQLSQVGITTGAIGQSTAASKTGHLSLDKDKLVAALQNDPNAVEALFGNTTVSVDDEAVGTSNGIQTMYTLKNGNVSSPVLKSVSGNTTTTYNQVTTFSTDADTRAKEYIFDYKTGQVTFGAAPVAGATITASYTYDVSSGSNAGIFVQMKTALNGYTNVGGSFDSLIGSDGSVTNMIKYNNDRIKDMKLRLTNEQTSLYSRFNTMQTLLLNLQSQGSFLTSQLSAMSSSSSK